MTGSDPRWRQEGTSLSGARLGTHRASVPARPAQEGPASPAPTGPSHPKICPIHCQDTWPLWPRSGHDPAPILCHEEQRAQEFRKHLPSGCSMRHRAGPCPLSLWPHQWRKHPVLPIPRALGSGAGSVQPRPRGLPRATWLGSSPRLSLVLLAGSPAATVRGWGPTQSSTGGTTWGTQGFGLPGSAGTSGKRPATGTGRQPPTLQNPAHCSGSSGCAPSLRHPFGRGPGPGENIFPVSPHPSGCLPTPSPAPGTSTASAGVPTPHTWAHMLGLTYFLSEVTPLVPPGRLPRLFSVAWQ